MRSDIPADIEKTLGPEPTELRENRRLKEFLNRSEVAGGQCARAMSDEEILAELFKYHAPTDETIPKFAAINQAAKNFAEVVLQNCPRGQDRRRAIDMIRDARMVANASVALNGLSL